MAKQNLTKEIGSSGVFLFNGAISGEEYNVELAGKRGLREYDKMRRNDATVNAALTSFKEPILNAEYEVDAASDDEKDQLVAKFVETNLFHLLDWEQFLSEALTYPEMGFAVFEQVFEPREVEGIYGLALKKLAFRKQTTISNWETADHQPGIQQYLADGSRFSIPQAKLVVFTHKQEGLNHEGISILRTAYKHWKIKDQLYKIDAVGHENHALGILKITKPKGASPEDESKMREFAMNRRANAQSHIIQPEGWESEFMDMKASTLRDIMPSIAHHDRQVLKNVLAQFLDFGSSGASGSRSTSEDHSRLFELSVQALARRIVHVLQNTVVRNLVDLNFTGVEYPTLRVAKISDDNIPVLSEAVSKLVSAKALHPRPADENTLRKIIGLPEVEDDELEKLYNQGEAATSTPEKPKQNDPEEAKVTADAELRALRASVEKALYEPTDQAA